MARREFAVIMLCGDAVTSGLVASSYRHQCLITPAVDCAVNATYMVEEKILAISHRMNRSLLRLFDSKQSKVSCVIPKEWKRT